MTDEDSRQVAIGVARLEERLKAFGTQQDKIERRVGRIEIGIIALLISGTGLFLKVIGVLPV